MKGRNKKMIRKETKTYLKDLYDSINEMSSTIIKFKVALHDLDKLGHNIEEIEKLLKYCENTLL